MTDWYRNTDWSDEIGEEFERRLARSRSQKAQSLSLQGYALIPKHPDVAQSLLMRAVAIDDEYETARARGFLAMAQLAIGDIDAALRSYESALDLQTRQPNIVAVQPADYIFVVGVFERQDRLAAAELIADALPDEVLFGPDPQLFAAKALVYALIGRTKDTDRYAHLALSLMADMPDTSALGIDLKNLKGRLQKLAAPD